MNEILQKLYYKTPAFIKNLLVSLYGSHLKRLRYGDFYKKLYEEEKNNFQLTENELKEIQLFKLKRLLLESNKFSPYYKEIFSENGITDDKIMNAETADSILRLIPFLEKSTLRNRMKDIVSTNPNRRTVSIAHTSGSTGTPMNVEQDAEATQYSFALWRRFYDWMGLPRSFRCARFSGRIIVSPNAKKPPFWVYNKPQEQLFMSTYHLCEENLSEYINELNIFRPKLIDGYPSAICILANYMLRTGKKLNHIPIAIATTAETLSEEQRDIIEKAFGCKVFNQYASSEGAPFATQCRKGRMHLWTDTGCFEFINSKPYNNELNMAEIVVTSFRSFKTPLIRYKIGDAVLIYKNINDCGCKFNYPSIYSIIGRLDDVLYTKEKGYVGRMDTAYKGIKGIKESQIIQNDIDHIDIYIVKDTGYSKEQEKLLMRNIVDRLGEKVSYNIIYKDSITRGANGKFRTVIRQFNVKV